MIEADFEHWERLYFRDYLVDHPEVCREYELLKMRLAVEYPNDRAAYTNGKTEFIRKVTDSAKRLYGAR